MRQRMLTRRYLHEGRLVMDMQLVTGNHAAGHSMSLAGEANRDARGVVCGIYPITPQTEIVEYVARFPFSKGRVIPVESEHSAMGVCIGASLNGARTFTASSANGLAYMAENVIVAAFYRLPIVMAAVNRTLGPPWNIWADQGDSLMFRDFAWIQLYCHSNQDVADTTMLAFRLAEDQRPPRQVPERDFCGLPRQQTMRGDGDDRRPPQLHPVHILRRPQVADDTDFGLVVPQPRQHVLGVAGPQRQRHARMRHPEPPDRGRDMHRRIRHDPQPARHRRAAPVKVSRDFLLGLEEPVRQPEQALARLRQPHMPRLAVEQKNVMGFLKPPNLVRNRGLRLAKHLGRAGKPARKGHVVEGTKLRVSHT